MGFSVRFVLSIFLFNFLPNVIFCGVPVLIWESSAITEKEDVVPALSQLDVDEFSNHLIKKVHVHKPLICLFLEETLSVEDFSWQDTKHRGSFPQIKNLTGMSAKLEFITSVDDPVASLKELTISHDYLWKKFDGVKLPTESGIILVVKMKDPLNNEDRPDMLRRHDGNIAEIYSQLLAKHSRIIAVFTGKQSSWVESESNRVRREASPAGGVDYQTRDIKLHSDSPPVISTDGTNTTLSSEPTIKFDNRTGYTRMILTYHSGSGSDGTPGKVVLRMKFPKLEKQWSLSEIEYESEGRSVGLTSPTDITTDIGKSFSSSTPVIFKSESGNITLQFNDLLVQAYMVGSQFSSDTNGTTKKNVFFTEAIWSGLIVTFVMGMILTWGLIMLLDIKTMDRFDDPKGKTITVTANE